MASVYEGLYVQYESNQKQFKGDLKSINSELTASTKLGRELDKALQFDDSGVEDLEASLKNVDTQLKLTEAKASTLQDELDRLSKIDYNALIAEQEKLGDELNDSKTLARSLKDELKELEKINAPEEEIQKLTQEIEEADSSVEILSASMKAINADLKALDPANITRLEAELQKTNNQTKAAKQSQEQYNAELKNIDSQGIDDLNSELKETAKYTDDIEGLSGSFEGLTGVVDTSVNSLQELAQTWGGVVGGVVATVGAIDLFSGAAEESAILALELSTSLNTTGLSVQELIGPVRNVSAVLGIDFAQGAELASATISLFGNEINTADQFASAMFITTQALNSEVGSLEQVIGLFNDVQSDTNATTLDAINIFRDAESAIKIYGSSADDIVDSFREWFPLFAELGVSADEFNNILISGLELGAKSTDEVANAFNELILRLGDGSAEATGALTEIGLTFTEIEQIFLNEGITGVFITIVEAMNASTEGMTALEEQTFLTNVAFGLFGTAGEEFVSQLASNDESVQALVSSQDSLVAQEQTLITLQSLLTESAAGLTEQLGLTETQQANLGVATERSAIAGLKYLASTQLSREQVEQFNIAQQQGVVTLLKYTQTLGLQGVIMQALADQGIITSESFDILSEAQRINQEEGVKATLSYLLQSGALQLLADKGLISQAQVDALTEAQTLLTEASGLVSQGIITQTESLIENGEQMGLSENSVALLESSLAVLTDTESTATEKTYALTNIMDLYGQALDLTREEQRKLDESLKILNDETSTGEEKVQALKDAYQTLVAGGLEPNLEATQQVRGTTDLLSAALDSQKLATENTEQALFNINKEQGNSITATEDYADELDNLSPLLKDLKGELAEAAGGFFDTGNEAGTAEQEVEDLTDAIGVFNSTPVQPKTFEINTVETGNASSNFLTPSELGGLSNSIPTTDASVLSATAGTVTNSNIINLDVQVRAETGDPQRLASEIAQPIAEELAKFF